MPQLFVVDSAAAAAWHPEQPAAEDKSPSEPEDEDLGSHSARSSNARSNSDSAAEIGESERPPLTMLRTARSQSLTHTASEQSAGVMTPSVRLMSTHAMLQRQPASDGQRQPQQPPLRQDPCAALLGGSAQATDSPIRRRVMSAELSLSMLQQELGYPRRKLSRTTAGRTQRRRGSSLLEDTIPLRGETPWQTHDLSEGLLAQSFLSAQEPEPEQADRPSDSLNQRESDEEEKETAASVLGSVDQYEDDEDDEEENFLDSRVVSVTGYSRDADGVVYYEVLIKSSSYGPLSAYTVRRRFSEFCLLHEALAQIMPVSKRVKISGSLSNSSRSRARVSTSELSSPPGAHTDNETLYDLVNHSSQLRVLQSRSRGREHECHLPPLPDKGGLWSYFQFDNVAWLDRRAKYFHAMLIAAQAHPGARASRILNEFVGTPPDSVALHTSLANSYVSLNRFAVPKLRPSIEFQERKEIARNIHMRRSSIHRPNSPRASPQRLPQGSPMRQRASPLRLDRYAS